MKRGSLHRGNRKPPDRRNRRGGLSRRFRPDADTAASSLTTTQSARWDLRRLTRLVWPLTAGQESDRPRRRWQPPMNLGNPPATIGEVASKNFLYFVCENGTYEANGGHPILDATS